MKKEKRWSSADVEVSNRSLKLDHITHSKRNRWVVQPAAFGYDEADAEANYHLFVFAAFFTPLLGAWLSDRCWGKYRTSITLSLVSCAGHAVRGLAPGEAGLVAGLGLFALGAGGIKPCASAHAGDQLVGEDKALTSRLFGWWYVSINVGSFLASRLMPR